MDFESLRQLQLSMSQIDHLVQHAVARAQAAGRDPTDALRGLIISEEEVATPFKPGCIGGFVVG